MSGDLEEGEIEGELGELPVAITAGATPNDTPQEQQLRAAPRERFLAMTPAGRAPYFAEPGSDGFKGRGGGGKKKKKKKSGAAGFVDVYGQGASAAVELYPEQGPIRLSDAQNLVLWVLGDGSNPRWCFVQNKPLLKKVLLLAAHGVDAQTWEHHGRKLLPAWQRHLGEPILLQARNATLAPGSTVHSLLTVPQTKKRRREEEQAAAPAQQQEDKQVPPPPPPPAAAAPAEPAAAAAAAAGLDLHEAAHGVASPADAGAINTAAANGADSAADGTPAAAPAAAKRMKVAADDDVSSRVAPQLEAAAPGQQAAGGAAAAAERALQASAAAGGVAAAGAGPSVQQQQQPQQQREVRRCGLPPSHYVLTLDQLQEHGYPLPQLDAATGEMACPPGFVATQSCKGTPQHDLVAVDCEMCITEAGFELTRATLVDRHGKVLLDELVLPHNPITDHNTRYSGITAAMLEGVTTRLEDVQALIRSLVSAETVLVAHSGENDLQALKIIHANVVDTAVLYPHPRGPPFKSALRVLASRHLLRTIQQGEHNPVEDARAAMDLALLKFERGPAYGAGGGDKGDRLVELLGEAGRRSSMVDRLEVLNKHVSGNCSAVVAEGDSAVVAQLGRELQKPQLDFAWGQLLALQQFYEERLAAARDAGEPEPSAPYRRRQQQQQQQMQQQQHAQGGRADQQSAALPPPAHAQQQQGEAANQQQDVQQQQQQAISEQQAAALASLDASVQQLWEAAPPGTMLVVVTGQGDTSYSRYLQEHKWRRQQGLDGLPPWSPACEAHLAAVQDQAMSALLFAGVKPAAPAPEQEQQAQQQQAQ